MALKVKQTARKRTLQIEGLGFPWVQPVLPFVPIPDSDDDEGNRAEVKRHLNEPRYWNLFLTNKAWEFYKENRKRRAIIERRLLNEGHPSTYIADKGWEGLCNPDTRHRLLPIKEFYANLAGIEGE
ncbi:OLC1v1012807C1 [Oldenlandia corymbosa var. corymbosa]|uniref:OLC1v1012807C1 n=1 Tax=Oldenlandia corymbosa var. corymbosa TaxID=529605 RepID=A0AAV1DX11_OLDCO|nr:OLC1v1012807C1 [Oldenlandia corymbosa var. corymbosa]